MTALAAKLDAALAPATAPPLLTVRGLAKHFPVGRTLLGGGALVRAVDGVDFDVMPGETLGVVGESGCGKSTVARLAMHLMEPTAGQLLFDGKPVGSPELPLREFRRQVQMVFQDSYASLNPRLTVEGSIAFGPEVHGLGRRESMARAHELLRRVGLEPSRFAGRYPHELSGGQRQRVNIARALAFEPRLLILDEAVSALDKSVEAQVLNLLLDLKDAFRLTYIFISHDLDVVRFMADRVLVMYLGRIAELGPSDSVLETPAHPYTRALLASVPSMDPKNRIREAPLAGDPPNPINPPSGCRFHPRCALAEDVCSRLEPVLAASAGRHPVACHAVVAGSGHSRAPAPALEARAKATMPSGAAR
ncbi:MAG: ABC transporter ATP-binding protein [Hyphomicrobiaceae bacterium]